jgi:predicted CXXCH cytochrome family protein
VDYTIGSKWQQAYATRLPNGQIHVFPLQYNLLHRRWLNFWKIIDSEDSERADVRSFEKFTEATSYQANCAMCHTSQLKNREGRRFEVDNLEFREPGINCEMCHGPSAQHVAAMVAGKPYSKQPLEPPVDFRNISHQDYLAICAQCHMQSAMREPGQHGELNYLSGSREFFQRAKSRPLAEFSRKAFYKDGRFRETTFIVESLERSACFKKGLVTCGHCHDPHSSDSASNPKSLKFLGQPDQMCLQCHARFSAGIETHTRHPAASEASRCVSCHMPPIMNSLLFKARTHQIDDVPNSEMTLRFGSEESPNACLMCHTAKDALWVKQQLDARVHPK